MLELAGRKVIEVEIDGIDPHDYPDYCDAYISGAVYEDNSEALSEKKLEQLTEENGDYINEYCHEWR